MLLFSIGLFLCLFICLYFLLVPSGVYGTSPVGITADIVRRRIEERLTEGDKAARLAIVNRSTKDIMKIGLLIGLGLGFLTILIGIKTIGVLAVPVAIFMTIAGIFLAEYATQNEFKSWQARMFEGVPVLVNFIPAFLEVGSITPREAISLTVPFLPEPLKSEVWTVLDKMRRTGNIKEPLDQLAFRARHHVVDSICSRLQTSQKASIKADIFDDLSDEIEDVQEMAATRTTTQKGGMFAMITVMGLLGAVLIFGYPGFKYMVNMVGGGFGM